MDNRLVELNDVGKEWLSRAVTVCGIVVFRSSIGERYILAAKRGPNVSDSPNKWCLAGGFLDYNETTQEAASREVYEETGYNINPVYFELVEVDSNPQINNQHIIFRYIVESKYTTYLNVDTFLSKSRLDKTDGEISEIRWVLWQNLEDYDWAFNHYNILHRLNKEGKIK